MNINDAYPSKYLKASDLRGNNVRVQILRVSMEDIAGGEQKPVVYFSGKEKGLVLNVTNANNIAAAHGSETEHWVGKEIVLFPTLVDFQGRSVDAIRCRGVQPKDQHQAPPPESQAPPPVDDEDIPF